MLNWSFRFRWVECQLEALRKCKRKSAIDKVLSQLPKNLHEQYQRDLANIPEEDEESALTLLKWLAFPQRKLRVEEVADLIAVDWDVDEPFFDPDDRLRDPSLVIGLCGSLIRTDKNPEGFNSFGEKEEVTTLTTSHSTVLDFLTSEALKVGTLPEARLSRATVNLQMATSCLGYLNTLFTTEKEMTQLNRDKMTEYPCARLAAEYWDDYYREVVKDTKEKVDLTQINEMVISLFDNKEKLLKWVQVRVLSELAVCTDDLLV